ncbi:MAG: TolC family protein [Phycisphaerales bacterium]|nr:TolC family protein [Phycisphaerales bacterium]MCI0674208.1 TolC family protein [Phycisphaerales bacterium]
MGCESGYQRIDRRVDALVREASGELGPDAPPPKGVLPPKADASPSDELYRERPPTVNPSASELKFQRVRDADDVLGRLKSYNEVGEDAMRIDLPFSLAYATAHAREHQFAQEEYVLAGLRLLVERHRWGPRFFDEITAEVLSEGDDGFYETSLRLVNEFRVTQRLPYGGELSARALASATEDLHNRVSDDAQEATIILEAQIPLLRGSGMAAREELIQRERDVIYAARDYEQFRRDFLFQIAQDFLNLVVQQQSVVNAQRQVAQLREVEQRERSLYEAGRTPLFQAALAEQATVSALDDLNSRQEGYRLAVDRFKLRLSIPIEQDVVIAPSSLDLPVPEASLDEAVREAMLYRLDLQTQRDQVDDARRRVLVARNNVLADLNLTGAVGINGDPNVNHVHFDPGETSLRAGITFGLPLDREIERIGVRQAQIDLERQELEYGAFRDEVALEARAAVRDIDRARYTLEIQERNVGIGQQRIASIEAAPDRADARDASDAANELLVAEDRRDQAKRDLEVAILSYLLETGQLRVNERGFIRPLPGMDGD